MSLLSIPSLVNKTVVVLIFPGNANMIDLEDEYAVLGFATQDEGGLFYNDDNKKEVPKVDSNSNVPIKSMMAVIKKHLSKSKTVSK